MILPFLARPDCASAPVTAPAGKISDLITTGTAPEFGSMAPMSM